MSLLLLLGNSSSGAGPNKFARFNGTTDFATISPATPTTSAGTLMIRCRLDNAIPAAGKTAICELYTSFPDTHYPLNDGTIYVSIFRVDRVGPLTPSGSVDRTGWHWFIVRDDITDNWECLQATDDGTLYSLGTTAHQDFGSQFQWNLIGKSSTGGLFDGDMDRFLWFPTRLSNAAIQAVIAGGNGTSPTIRYEFSSNAGGIFADASGNGYDATISGTPTIVTA